MKFAVYASARGKKGSFGGSVYHSHAFDNADVKNAYINRYGKQLQKDNYRVLFWKENQLIYNYISRNENVVHDLINRNIKFITPVRNPLDIARSYKENQFTHLLYNKK